MDISAIPAEIRNQWNNNTTPIIIRSGVSRDKLTARLPYRDDNRRWLTSLAKGSRKPEINWLPELKAWKLPLSWFNRFVDSGLERYGRLYVVQPFREMEKCAPACRSALGHECQCSCMGANHGAGDGTGWFDVSDTFSFRWGLSAAAIRLMTKKP